MNSVNVTPRIHPAQQGVSARVILKNFTFLVDVFQRNVTGNKVTLAPASTGCFVGVCLPCGALVCDVPGSWLRTRRFARYSDV